MSDVFLQISGNPRAKKMASQLGLPIPQVLKRSGKPWAKQPLEGKTVVVGGAGNLHETIADTLARAGANVGAVDGLGKFYAGPAEAFARPLIDLDGDEAPKKVHGLVFDATFVKNPDDLRHVYDFFHARIRSVGKCGRVVVFGQIPEEMKKPEAQASNRALEGFVKSVSKEIGRNGATATMVYVGTGAESRVAGLLRWLLTERSAYLTGQPFTVTKTAVEPDKTPYVRPLEGKVALVTGAARGIGAATAKTLAREGAHVVCLDLPSDDEPLSLVAKEVGGSVLHCDLSEPDAPETIASHLKKHHGGVDIVVHNAGVTRDKTLGNMKEEAWDLTLAVNLRAIIATTQRLLDGVFRKNGRIVCLSSIAGIAGNFGQTNYAATKAGVIGFVQGLAPTVAKQGITINAVAPGFVETRMTAAIPFMTRNVGRRFCTLSQSGLPSDIAEAITFFSSPGAFGLTGNTVRVCGGNLLGA